MEKVIVVASTNKGKIREFKEMLEPKGYTVKSLADFPDLGDIDENGTTFEENAVIKADAVTKKYGIEAVADDSGLCIDAFDGGPGVHSARFLGHDTSYDYKNAYILDRLKDKKTPEERGCHYVCAIAITRPGKEPVVFSESCYGVIADQPAGNNGFGYDPIVYYPPMHKTMAEMTKEEKNSISHRGKAVRRMEEWMNEEAD